MRFLTVLPLILALVSSCEVKFNWTWNKPETQTQAKASGKTVTEDRTIGAFSTLRLEGLGKLVFDQAVPAGTIRITGDQGLLAHVRADVSGTGLTLKEDQVGSLDAFQLEFRVAAPETLSNLTLAGLGSVESLAALKTGDLTVSLEGMGKVDLALAAGSVVLHQRGQGELTVRGTADRVEIRAEGLGKVDTAELKTKAADVANNGLGEVKVFASQSLKVRASGVGAVHFFGHPAQTDVQTEGLTKVSAGD
ncbi:MAG TPA: DUF2807 domain-containing protein [Spirochaetia bacterium]|nr:DUF2807 domain-containing protein [Spirochaetia bacterium]